MTTQLTGILSFADWEEHAIGSPEAVPRIARASVANTFAGGIVAARTDCAYSIAYVDGKEGVFIGMELVAGSVDGHAGTFVLQEHGTFGADGAVRCTFTVVPGSGTGALAGLSGTGDYVCRSGQAAFPYTFGYALDHPRPAQD